MRRLEGRVVATTRDGEPDDPLADGLHAEGARVVDWSTLAFGPTGADGLRHAIERIEDFDWIIFTSARAVDPVVDLVGDAPDAEIASVGPSTAAALESRGWRAAVVGAGGSDALVDALSTRITKGTRVLFPAGSRAGHTIEHGLHALGASVHRAEAYRTIEAPPDRGAVLRDLAQGVDAVTFTSPSAVASLSTALSDDWPHVLVPCEIVVIGETTAAAARLAGIAHVHIAPEPSLASVVETCCTLFPERRRHA